MSIRITTKTMNYQAIPGLITNRKYESARRLTIEEVAEGVALKTGISIGKMQFKTRIQDIVEARQIVMYICTMIVKPNYTTKAVGDFFYLDHATVIHGRKQVDNLMQTDKDYQYRVLLILEALHI